MLYGFGSYYNGNEEKMSEFVKSGAAYIGYDKTEAPGLFEELTNIKAWDIVFLKSYPPATGLFIKAIGIVENNEKCYVPTLGHGVPVRWLWSALNESEYIRVGIVHDKIENTRGGTIYHEYGPKIQQIILDKISSLIA